MTLDNTFCTPKEPDLPICKTCKRNWNHKSNSRFKDEVRISMSQFKPIFSQIQGLHCDYEMKE